MKHHKSHVAALVALSVLATAAVAFAGTDSATRAARGASPGRLAFPHPCSKVTVAGHKWSIVVSNFSCGAAANIVRRLAPKKVPANRAPYKGTFSGVKCEGGPTPGKLPKSIICSKKKGGFPAVNAFRG